MSGPTGYAIVARIERLRQTATNQWIARCPAHEDSTESLSISVGRDERLLLHCQAGCSVADVLRSINATSGDLFLSPPPRAAAGSRAANQGRIVATYDYRDAVGTLLYQSCRIEPGPNGRKKTFRQRAPRTPGDEKSGWTWTVANIPRVLYRLPQILAADPSAPVLIVEGEKDADNLARGGFVATTNVSGAGKWFDAYSVSLAGRHCVIIPDNDDPGRKHAVEVAASLAGRAASVRVLRLDGLPEKGDVSDWIKIPGNTPARLRELIDAAPGGLTIGEIAAPAPPAPPAAPWEILSGQTPYNNENSDKLSGQTPYNNENSDKLSGQTPYNNALPAAPATPVTEHDDDPHRLARLFLSRFSHPDGPTLRFWRDSWWRWDGQIYCEVPTPEVRAAVTQSIKIEFDRIAAAKLAAGPSLADNGPIRAARVTARLIADTILALAGMTILPGEVDAPAWLDSPSVPAADRGDVADFLCLQNGILSIPEILSDDPDPARILTPHTPALFTRNRIPYPYLPDAECPTWQHFLATSLESSADAAALLQEWFGYCLTPDTSMQRFLMLEGEGSNGKSVVCAALTALLGESNVSAIPLEMFGDNFSLSSTLGKLANVVSEVGELDKVSEGFLKSFTAGDRMTFDRKFKAPIVTVPTARLILATNNFPRYADKSQGIWRRVLLLKMTYTVPADERIFGMDKPGFWTRSSELPGMLLWALAGLQELRRYRRFTIPVASSDAIESHRREANPLREFLTEHYVETDDRNDSVPVNLMYKRYADWCKENGLHAMSSINLGKEISRIFRGVTRQRIRDDFNNRCWGYLKIREMSENDKME